MRELLPRRPPGFRAAAWHNACGVGGVGGVGGVHPASASFDQSAARGRGNQSYGAAMAKYFPDLEPFYAS